MPPQRTLTTSQQALLEEHLDATFRNIDRDYNKRTDPESAIPTIDNLLSVRLSELLSLILAIPSTRPTAHVQIAYLLRFTAAAREWIAGYPLTWPDEYARRLPADSNISEGDQAQRTADLLLEFLQSLDQGWQKVLSSGELSEGSAVDADSAAIPHTRRTPVSNLTVTERIRLRSSILSLRQTLIRWIERQRKGRRQDVLAASRGTTQSLPLTRKSSPSAIPDSSNDSDADMSTGFVDAAIDGNEKRGNTLLLPLDEESLGDWEIAIANSMAGTLELIL